MLHNYDAEIVEAAEAAVDSKGSIGAWGLKIYLT